MAKQYVLLKLPVETVRALKKRQHQLGKKSINELIIDMINILDDRNAILKSTGWQDGAISG
jgi:hypothetical protein